MFNSNNNNNNLFSKKQTISTFWLLISVQLLLVLFIAIAVIYGSILIRNTVLTHSKSSLLAQAANFETLITQNLDLLQKHIDAIEIDNKSELHSNKEIIDQIHDILEKLIYIRSISIIDPSTKKIIYSTTPDNQDIAVTFEHNKYVSAPKEPGVLAFSIPWIGRDFYNAYQANLLQQSDSIDSGFIPIISYLWGDANLILTAVINSDYFINRSNYYFKYDTHYSLYLDNGILLLSTDHNKKLGKRIRVPSEKSVNDQLAIGQHYIQEEADKISVYAPSKSYPWFVLTEASKESLLEEWKQETKQIYLAVILVFAIIFFIIGYMTYKAYINEMLIRLLSQAIEQSPSSIMLTDTNKNIIYANQELIRSSGYSRNEIIGSTTDYLSSGLTPSATYSQLWSALEKNQSWQGEFINKRKDNSIYIERALISPLVNSKGKITHYLGYKHDITHEKKIENELILAASVMENTLNGIMICNSKQIIIDINPAFTEITGYTRNDILGKTPSVLASGKQNRTYYANMWTSLESTGQWRGEFWNKRKNGDLYAALSSINIVRNSQGEVSHYINVFSDVTELRDRREQLELMAHYDSLTRLPNRTLLIARLEEAIVKADTDNNWLAVCFMDLDGFKAVNDNHGHEIGDKLLIEIARRLKGVIFERDTAARLGGDEFVILLTELHSHEQYQQAADKLLKVVSDPIYIDGLSLNVSGSMGITVYPHDNADAGKLLRHADHAMYQAKQTGRNRFVVFNS